VFHQSIGRRIRLFTASSVAAIALALTGCGSSTSPADRPVGGTAGAAPLQVVASTDVYGSIVTAVGGDRVTVTSIIHSPGADPHEYEATPADAVAVNRATLVVVNGGGYDDFATKLADAAPAAPKVLNVVDLSDLRPGAGAPGFNEHVWYSLPAMKKLADRLAGDLGAADPADAATFSRNAAAFNSRIDGLIAKVAAVKDAHAGDKVAITEPVPLYLVQDAGLTNATPEKFSEAVEEGTDPPAAVLDDTLALFTGKQVKALLTNAQTESPSTRKVEQAAAAAGIPQVPVAESLPTGVDDYVTWQDSQISALAGALDTAA
jgi:zinc/manganese transport system substrate-binding protein